MAPVREYQETVPGRLKKIRSNPEPQRRPWMTDDSVFALYDERRLDTLDQLRDWSSSRHTVLLGLDVEGADFRLEYFSHCVGFAFMVQPVADSSRDTTGSLLATQAQGDTTQARVDTTQARMDTAQAQVDLAEQVRRYNIDAHVLAPSWLRADKPRTHLTDPETFPFVKLHDVEQGDFEQELVTRLLAIKEAHRDPISGQTPEIIMAVFSWASEFAAMNHVFPKIAQHISRWVDVATMVETAPRPRFLRGFTLNEAMKWLRLGARYLQYGKHCPGMDAVRTLGVLMALLAMPAGTIPRFQYTTPSSWRFWSPKLPPPSSKPRPIITQERSWDLDDDFSLPSWMSTGTDTLPDPQ